jgi:outer membrane protein W
MASAALAAVATFVIAPRDAAAQQVVVGAEQGRGYFEQRLPAPKSAFELSVGTGYTQGLGMLQQGVSLPDVASAGIAADVGVGYRIDPHWMIGVDGEYQELDAQRFSGARGLTGTLAAQYHVAPHTRLDPWLEIGAGYRALWEARPSPNANLITHGLQLARARVGVDWRVAPAVAVGPMVGADATLFLWQDAGALTGNVAIASPRVSTFLFGGIQGRFDIGGNDANEMAGTTIVTSDTLSSR